jgi:hypothetical protein
LPTRVVNAAEFETDVSTVERVIDSLKVGSVVFRLTYTVHDPGIARAIDGAIECVPISPGDVAIRFERHATEERLNVRGEMSKILPPKLEEQFKEISQGRLPKGSSKKDAVGDLDSNGNLKPNHLPPMAALPSAFQHFCDEVSRDLYKNIRSVVDLVRWRGGFSGGAQNNLVSYVGFVFSLDAGQTWRPVPHRLTMRLSIDLPISSSGITQAIVDEAARMSGRLTEPVSRQLFREAWGIRESNPRSALVIGYCAVEVGCKEFIQDVAPSAGWLAIEAPSPPIDRILKSYLPMLPCRIGHSVSIPERHRKLVQKAMNARNNLAHRGTLVIAAADLEEILRAINDVLWLLNYYAGHKWALGFVSPGGRPQSPATIPQTGRAGTAGQPVVYTTEPDDKAKNQKS